MLECYANEIDQLELHSVVSILVSAVDSMLKSLALAAFDRRSAIKASIRCWSSTSATLKLALDKTRNEIKAHWGQRPQFSVVPY
jgi:hypothetical protein